ncbi:unnamed protein product [Debaryomyces fabryi]|nr:unnamed protein product [Debaryomyces fabryi]
MHKGLLLLDLFVLVCLMIQLLPVISVPITGKEIGYNLHLSKYGNYTFGVFGLCTSNNICSRPKIGYPSETDEFYSFMDDDQGEYPDFAAAELPSKARYAISKLLVVHLVGFCFTGILFLVTSALTVILWLEESETKVPFKDVVRKKVKIRQNSRNNSSTDLTETTSATKMDSLSDKGTLNSERKTKDITPYLNLMLMLSLLSFLLTLLAFLSDMLLFIPHLSYLGWLQLCPIILLSTVTSMLCFIKRSISSRKYLTDEYGYENDDMRKRVNVGVLNWKDTDSDDGFYVYTNGFYSNYNNDDNHQEGQSHAPELFPANNSTHGWIRHSGYNENGDDVSISSSRDDSYNEHENIQMRLLSDHGHDS